MDQNGWEILFDGKNLDAWQYDPQSGVWAINAQGELYPLKAGPDLFTKNRYCDYVIELDCKMAARSGRATAAFSFAFMTPASGSMRAWKCRSSITPTMESVSTL